MSRPNSLSELRAQIRQRHRAPEDVVLNALTADLAPDDETRGYIKARAVGLVQSLRAEKDVSLMEAFLSEYGLSTDEGVALMCLAEALLRVPDTETVDALIEDKIVRSNWEEHSGDSASTIVNASTFALSLVGKVLDPAPPAGVISILQGAVKRLGEPVIRAAIAQSMKFLGKQFVLGRTIEEAVEQSKPAQKRGFSFSYDMLGEAAMTAADAYAYYLAYGDAISCLSGLCKGTDARDNPGISIKLSALHPRYELKQRDRVMREMVPRVKKLALAAKQAHMGLNIDAEEADRLDISLDIIETLLADPDLAGWDGFGVVIQAYGKRAAAVIQWLYTLAETHDRKVMVRLVKGAYWDTEIKRAHVDGVEDFPVFTRKAATDVSYICCAKLLFDLGDRIYPQFATHNAHTAASILELAGNDKPFEFQRLHGMGETLLNTVMDQENCRCRIYAPVGAHKDLLAYLVRRLLENGANSSFVNQVVDETVPAEEVAADPFETLVASDAGGPRIIEPHALYGARRANSKGWDLLNERDLATYQNERQRFARTQWQASPTTLSAEDTETGQKIVNPADPSDTVGTVIDAGEKSLAAALDCAEPWDVGVDARADILRRAADHFEANSGELFALLAREAGKTPQDAVAELREAVDFLRYYAAEAEGHAGLKPCGLFTCISPWNFPLAIFTGQVAAALAAGNGVLAKPAETTPLIAAVAVRLMHEAGVPTSALQLVPGPGARVGAALVSDRRIDGVCFTGSTATAQSINRAMAEHLAPQAPLIAETGGLNAMIVDSTALAEQAVRDIVASAFQSAGQRCSALRMLYVQEDVADEMLEMLYGAMDELSFGMPWNIETDIGPVIDRTAQSSINTYIEAAKKEARVLKQLAVPQSGHFVNPTVISVNGIEELEREVFGPVLHVARFRAGEIEDVIDAINNSGYGLTFGLHTRINDRVDHVKKRIRVGNFYVNRNQIGAVVGSQPFGGEGLSGTGPKAGGPKYLLRFAREILPSSPHVAGEALSVKDVQKAINRVVLPKPEPQEVLSLPGPTGEKNELSTYARGLVLCMGPTPEEAAMQAAIAADEGCSTLVVVPGAVGPDEMDGYLPRQVLEQLEGFAAVALWSDEADLSATRRALAAREGPILPVLATREMARWCHLERHVCIDTTAAGGNASLLAGEE